MVTGLFSAFLVSLIWFGHLLPSMKLLSRLFDKSLMVNTCSEFFAHAAALPEPPHSWSKFLSSKHSSFLEPAEFNKSLMISSLFLYALIEVLLSNLLEGVS